jgi:NH3-dependent NAD+ synthetase
VPLTRRIRLLGVRIAALSQASNAPQDVLAAEPTPSLFDEISDLGD